MLKNGNYQTGWREIRDGVALEFTFFFVTTNQANAKPMTKERTQESVLYEKSIKRIASDISYIIRLCFHAEQIRKNIGKWCAQGIKLF